MAEKSDSKSKAAPSAATTSAKHPAKVARDEYGGDPLDPNDAVLERIAKAIKSQKEDDLVSRWATATLALYEGDNKPNTPKRILLCKIAEVADGGDDDEEVTAWASGDAGKQVPRSVHNLDHLG